jgi:hypothetical protein
MYRDYDDFYVNCSLAKAIRIINGSESWQSEDFTFTEVERVYSTRLDCMVVPGRARRAA